MTKKFTQSIFILILLNLLVKPFWIFGIDRTIQNVVGAEEYGLYFSLFSFSILFNMIADFGITNYNNRTIARNNDLIGSLTGTIFPIKLLLAFVYALFTLTAAFVVNYSNEQIILLIWLTINQILISFTQYLRSNISGLQLFKTDSLLSVMDKFVLIVLCGILLWVPGFTTFRIEWLVYSQTIAYTVNLLFAIVIVLHKTGRINFRIQFSSLVSLLKQSSPFAILTLLMMLYTRIDAVMLERMLPVDGKLQAGIYAQAFRILDALSMFAFLFASILLPLFAKMIKEKQPIIEILGHSFALLIVPSLGLLAGITFYAKEFMQLLYHQHIDESTKILQLLMFGFMGICASYIFGTLLTSAGKLKALNQTALVAVLLNILLNYLLIPGFGAVGAAFSSMLTQVLMGIIQGIISFKEFQLKIRWSTIFKYGLLVIILAIVTSIIYYVIGNWFLALVLMIGFTILLGFLFKVLKINHFKELFSK